MARATEEAVQLGGAPLLQRQLTVAQRIQQVRTSSNSCAPAMISSARARRQLGAPEAPAAQQDRVERGQRRSGP